MTLQRMLQFFVLIIVHHLILMLGEGPTDDINGGFGGAEKKFCINFGKAKSIFCLSLHDNHDNSLFVC